MPDTIRWDMRAAAAVLAITGTLVIVFLWSDLFIAVALDLDFVEDLTLRDLNFREYMIVFSLVRLPVLLGIIGGAIVLFHPKASVFANATACTLYIILLTIWWTGEEELFYYFPGMAIFGFVLTGTAAYIALMADQIETRMARDNRGRAHQQQTLTDQPNRQPQQQNTDETPTP